MWLKKALHKRSCQSLPPSAESRPENREEERLPDNLQANLLFNQINPHFLYNALESIRGKAQADGNTQVADMIEALSAFFRYNVSNKSQIVTLSSEIRNVEEYFKIQEFRSNGRFSLHLFINVEDEIEKCVLPKLTLQPIVENAIVHGLEPGCDGGKITIRVIALTDSLSLYIEDNGLGMPAERVDTLNEQFRTGLGAENPGRGNGTGIALTNINLRIKLLFGKRYGLHIYSTVGVGTTVEMLLPRITFEAYASQRRGPA